MNVPILWGKPINVWLGILLMLLLTFQILTGRHIVKLPFSFHKRNVIVIILVVAGHAFYGLGIWFFNFSIKP